MTVATAYSDADCTLQEQNPTLNYDGGYISYLEGWGMQTKSEEMDVLMRVDFSDEVPAGATISAATLNMSVLPQYNGVLPSSLTWPIRRCLRSWVVNQATFNVYSTGNNWTTPGARGVGTDYTNTDAVAPAGVDGGSQWWAIDVLALVLDAQLSRSSVFDVVLHSPLPNLLEGQYCYYQVASYLAPNRPYLEITYTVPGGAATTVRVMIF